jgi:ATP-dependent exoDNAse (exonuclease V) alpha subunit
MHERSSPWSIDEKGGTSLVLVYRIAAMIHAIMGTDFNRLIMSVSRSDSRYHLWEKEQAVVLLSRTFTVRDLIFVGDKVDTINALASLIQTRSQYTKYILHLP